MRVKSGSATSVDKWLKCQAGWAAEYQPQNPFVTRTPQRSGSSASLGSLLHQALDDLVADEIQADVIAKDYLEVAVDQHWEHFMGDDKSRRGEASSMIDNWLAKHPPEYWESRTVIERERRRQFKLPTSQGDMPFTFVIDRLDKIEGGTYEVVDYKSWVKRRSSDQLHKSWQCRIYALAVFLTYPDVEEVWVTLDQLRYDEASALFTKEQAIETYNELIAIAEEWLAVESPTETINEDCRYCVRRNQCASFRAHMDVGGPDAIEDLDWAAQRWLELKQIQKFMYAQLGDLESFFMAFSRENEVTEFATEDADVFVEISSKNEVDKGAVAELLGEDLPRFIGIYGNPGVTSIRKAVKDSKCFLSDVKKAKLSSLIVEKYGETKVVVKPR